MISAHIDNKLRKAIYRREDFMCALCDDVKGLQVHHCIPRSQGGGNTPHNLICLCWRCHALAHGTNLFQDPDHQTITREDAELGIVEYLSDYYAGEWNPKGEGG